jgi:N6-adenosine-specific RNA methylase IME4
MTRYRTIVADPPWPFMWSAGKGGRRRRETELGYKTMSVADICALPVRDLADPDGCHLFLWVTDELLADGVGMQVAKAWGFRRAGPSIVWSKKNFGLGRFPRPSHEQMLVCRLGSLQFTGPYNRGSVYQWEQPRASHNGRRIHSAKPEGSLDLVEAVSPGPFLELFARRNRMGWDTWGNESLEHVEMGA